MRLVLLTPRYPAEDKFFLILPMISILIKYFEICGETSWKHWKYYVELYNKFEVYLSVCGIVAPKRLDRYGYRYFI